MPTIIGRKVSEKLTLLGECWACKWKMLEGSRNCSMTDWPGERWSAFRCLTDLFSIPSLTCKPALTTCKILPESETDSKEKDKTRDALRLLLPPPLSHGESNLPCSKQGRTSRNGLLGTEVVGQELALPVYDWDFFIPRHAFTWSLKKKCVYVYIYIIFLILRYVALSPAVVWLQGCHSV